MTSQRKQEITRYAVVTVEGEAEVNQYGDLKFYDTEGNEHKIGIKRSKLFDAIIPGRAVKLGYAVYMNKEYISTAELYDGQPADPAPKATTTGKGAGSPNKPSQPAMGKDDWAEKDRITRKSIERQTSLNAAVELAKVGIIKPDQVLPSARKFEEYLEGKEVQPAKSRLVEQAKGMDLKSVDEEDLPPF